MRHIFRKFWVVAVYLTLVMGFTSQVRGASGSWTNNAAGNWSATNNWAGGLVADGAGSTAWLTNNISAARIVTIDTTPRILGILTIGDADGTHAFTLNATGAGKLTLNNGGSEAQFNQAASSRGDTINAPLALADSTGIANDSTNPLTMSGAITSAVAGVRMLSNRSSGSGPVALGGIIGNGAGVIGVVQNSGVSPLNLSGANTFTGGLFIKKGLVNASASINSLGANTNVVTIGDTNGSADATLLSSLWATFFQPIVIASNNTGVASIIASNNVEFSGPVTLNDHSLVLTASTLPATGAKLTMSGPITGKGHLLLKAEGSYQLLLTGRVNVLGSITNAGGGSALVTISGGVGSNVMAISQASTGSPLSLITLPLEVNTNGAILANQNTGGSAVLTVSGGVRGIGDLVLNNNGPLTNGITLMTGAITNTGRIVNSGSGSGNTLVSAVIGTNVTGVVQNSGTSPLLLTAANLYTGGTSIDSGTLRVSNATGSATGPGAVTINDGGILRNDGSISGPVSVNNGGTLQGRGSMAGTVTNNHGGILSPGLDGSAGGTLTIGNLAWKGGGVYHCEVASLANNEAGAGVDYDLVVVTNGLAVIPGGSNLVLRLDSLGQTLAFDPSRDYSLRVMACGSAVLDPADVTLDTNAFLAGGAWSVTNVNNSIYVVCLGAPAGARNSWRGTGNWSTAANWSLGHVPLADEDVEFDFQGAANCTADVISNDLKSVALAAGYTGTVTFLTRYPGQGAFTNVTIAGDCIVNGGMLTHLENTTGELYRLSLAVGGNLTVNGPGQIQVDGKGYARDQGPGKPVGPSGQQGAAGHGGIGGYDSRSVRPGTTYGSITAPSTLGSGGGAYYDGRGSQSGGGAIQLNVAGTAVVNGVISAAGLCFDYNAGSGGSILLTAGALSGNGVVRANGGNAPSQYTGGGGRIAVILTRSAEYGPCTFQAFAGSGSSRGAGGTVYLENTNHTAGHGRLVVNYNDLAPGNSAYSYTLQSGLAASSYAFSEIILTNGALYALDTNDVLDITGTVIRGDPSDALDGLLVYGGTLLVPASFGFAGCFITLGTNATFNPTALLTLETNAALTLNAPLTLSCTVTSMPGSALTINAPFTLNAPLTVESGASLTINAAFPTNGPVTLSPAAFLTVNSAFTLNGPLTVAAGGVTTVNAPFELNGMLTVADGGVLTHSENTTNEARKMVMTVNGDVDVQAGGVIHADGKGYAEGNGPGKATLVASASGAGHGGQGAKNTGSAPGATYGSITAPMNFGSGGNDHYGSAGARGGGLVRLQVSGTTTVNGVISASGVVGAGVSYYAGGSGGSVFLTTAAMAGSGFLRANGGDMPSSSAGGGGRIAVILTNAADFAAVRMQAYTGKGWTAAGVAAPGTIYLESPAQGAGRGLLLIDASNQVTTVHTLIGSNVTDAVVGTVVLTNKAMLRLDTNQVLTVNGSWTNAATFIAATNSTVILAGGDEATVAGSNTFYNLVVTNAGKVVSFQAGRTNLVAGLLALGSAAPGSTVTLQSTVDGSWWHVALASVASGGTQQIARVTVKDSHAGGGQLLLAGRGSVDGGHNVNWQFPKNTGTVLWVR